MKIQKNVISLLVIISLLFLTINAVAASDVTEQALDDVIDDIADINTTISETPTNDISSNSDKISETIINDPSDVDENDNIYELSEMKNTKKSLTLKTQILENTQTISSESQDTYFSESIFTTSSIDDSSVEILTSNLEDSPNTEVNTILTNQLTTSNHIASQINDITIVVNTTSGNPNETITVQVQVYENGNPATNGDIIIDFNNQLYDSQINNGVANINITLPNTTGTYQTFIIYVNNKTYTVETNISVTDNTTPITHNIVIVSNNLSGNTGETITIPIQVYDNNIPVSSGTIILTVDNQNYYANVVNGVANTVVTLPTTAGTYDTILTYTDDGIIESTLITTTVTQNTTPTNTTTNITIISTNSINGTPGTVVTVPVYVYNNSAPVSSGTVIITLNNQHYIADVNNGVATVVITLPNTPGTYDSHIVYSNNDTVEHKSLTVTVTNNTPTELINTTIKLYTNGSYKVGDYIIGTITDVNNNPLANQVIALTMTDLNTGNSNVYYVTSNANGVFQYYGLKEGTYSIWAYYAGNDIYNSSTSVPEIITVTNGTVPEPGDNKTHNKTSDQSTSSSTNTDENISSTSLDNNATGNPIIILLICLSLLGIGIKRQN